MSTYARNWILYKWVKGNCLCINLDWFVGGSRLRSNFKGPWSSIGKIEKKESLEL